MFTNAQKLKKQILQQNMKWHMPSKRNSERKKKYIDCSIGCEYVTEGLRFMGSLKEICKIQAYLKVCVSTTGPV
jgi:hypothetical protein